MTHQPNLQYGFFPGGDPRSFWPDQDGCTSEEIANWRAACKRWDRAEAAGEPLAPEPCPSGWLYDKQGVRVAHITRSPYGIGTYSEDGTRHPADELTLAQAAVAALQDQVAALTAENEALSEAVAAVNDTVSLAERWAEKQLMPEGQICMAALKDVRRHTKVTKADDRQKQR